MELVPLTEQTGTATTTFQGFVMKRWKFCPECGKPLEETWCYCPHCGNIIGQAPPIFVPTIWPIPQYPAAPPPPNQYPWGGTGIIGDPPGWMHGGTVTLLGLQATCQQTVTQK